MKIEDKDDDAKEEDKEEKVERKEKYCNVLSDMEEVYAERSVSFITLLMTSPEVLHLSAKRMVNVISAGCI